MKTKEELNAIREEVKALDRKLAELSEGELCEIIGGTWYSFKNCTDTSCTLDPQKCRKHIGTNSNAKMSCWKL